jgi:N-acetylneuraminate lyase
MHMAAGLSGILPAVVTPMDARGEFLPEAFERLCGALYEAGVDGLYVCGQTGEGLQQSPEQRKRVVEAAVRNTPKGRMVMAHAGAASTAVAVELAKHAESVGADAVSSLPPAGSYSMEEVRAYYAAIAASVSIPLFVYFFPGFAANPKTLGDLVSLCEIPNVAGLKFTSTDLYTLSELNRQGAVIFSGFDEILVAGLLMGADGGIGSFYNVAPRWFVELYKAARMGDWAEARKAQARINEIITIGLRYPVHAAVKEMLRWQGIDCGVCAAPRRGLSVAEVSELRKALDESALAGERLAERSR